MCISSNEKEYYPAALGAWQMRPWGKWHLSSVIFAQPPAIHAAKGKTRPL
jgi:hypothetical protein